MSTAYQKLQYKTEKEQKIKKEHEQKKNRNMNKNKNRTRTEKILKISKKFLQISKYSPKFQLQLYYKYQLYINYNQLYII